MRSAYADEFNHDDSVVGYDKDVLNEETDPIRTGYAAVLDWTVDRAAIGPEMVVADLGIGTGNLAAKLPRSRRLIGVDVSTLMVQRAVQKLSDRPELEISPLCLLEFVHAAETTSIDRIVSTYAIHHLPREEKRSFFEQLKRILKPGGRAVMGDLMFADAAGHKDILGSYRKTGRAELADAIDEEFFWDVSACMADLEEFGFRTEAKRFSELSWVIYAELPTR